MYTKIPRNETIRFSRSKGISTTLYYPPLHFSPAGTGRLSYKAGDFPVTESVSSRLL
jgi:dTDP-4-amino-4,6-dideoxygalactose transaminase